MSTFFAPVHCSLLSYAWVIYLSFHTSKEEQQVINLCLESVSTFCIFDLNMNMFLLSRSVRDGKGIETPRFLKSSCSVLIIFNVSEGFGGDKVGPG